MSYLSKMKLLKGLVGLSFLYGFNRSWTLPIWHDQSIGLQFLMSSAMGCIYAFPPTAVIKYTELGFRVHDTYYGHGKKKGEHWKEWGFYHPRVI